MRQFPIDKLKIDRAFVKEMPRADDGVIASSIIALSDALGITIIGEAVETKLSLIGCLNLDANNTKGISSVVLSLLKSSPNCWKKKATLIELSR